MIALALSSYYQRPPFLRLNFETIVCRCSAVQYLLVIFHLTG